MLPQVETSLGNWVKRPTFGDEEPSWVCAVATVTDRGVEPGWAVVAPDEPEPETWWWAVIKVTDNGKPRVVEEGVAPTKEAAMRAAEQAAIPEWMRLAKAGAL